MSLLPSLTPKQRSTLLTALAPFAAEIERVALFGSRATGFARENSDIDLVIYGELDSKSERRLWTAFDESDLSVPVDVVAYSRINNPLLKQHIDDVAIPLFEHDELAEAMKSPGRLAAPPARPI